MKKLLVGVVFVMLLVASLVSVSCSPAAPEVIRVGCNVPLSGPAAYWGQCTYDAWTFGADEINKAGGVKVGNKSYMMEIFAYDSKNESTAAYNNAHSMVYQDKVLYVATQTAQSYLGSLKVTEPEKVINFACNWANADMIGNNFYSFRVEMSGFEIGFVSDRWVMDNYPGIKRVALIDADDEDGIGQSADARWHWTEEYGLEIATDEYYDWAITDFYPVVTKVLATKPDMIDCPYTSSGHLGEIVKAAREMGFTGPFQSFSALEIDPIIEIAGEYATDVICPATLPVGQWATDEQRVIQEKLIKLFGKFDTYTGIMSHYAFLLKAAIETAGTWQDTTAVANALEDVVLNDTFVGKVTFGGENKYGLKRQGLYTVPIVLIKNGSPEIVSFEFPQLPPGY